jgi:uncharacterized protein YegL
VKRYKVVILSVAISLVAHAAVLFSSPFIVLQGMQDVRVETRKMFRLEDVRERPVDVQLFAGMEAPVPSIKMTRQISERERIEMERMKLEERLAEDLPLQEKMEKLREELPKKILGEPEKFEPEEFLKAEAEKMKKEVLPDKRSLAERLLSEGPAILPAKGEAGEELRRGIGKMDYAGLAAVPGAEPAAGFYRPGGREITALEGEPQVAGYEDIDRFIDVRLFTYTDPRTKEKYFKIVISVKKGDNLAVIPKEVTFLIDSSKSITEDKLFFIKKAVQSSLEELNPQDRFNVVAFRGDVIRFEEKPVRVNERAVRQADLFLRKLVAVGQTDVSRALLEIVSNHITTYPSYVLFITDGRPTTGVIDSRRIIQQITRRNNMERPVFCFGGGTRVNRYLLDFISYQNRAWSRFAPTNYDIEKDFIDFYRQIKDPLLVNVRYRFSNLDTKEIYPKFLSDFYRGKPFVLYGRYDREDVFSVQLLGVIGGQTKEFIYKGSLKKAEAGGEDIAKEWAFTKVYHLISQLTMGMGDPVLLRKEMQGLSRKYGIVTPYDIKDEE